MSLLNTTTQSASPFSRKAVLNIHSGSFCPTKTSRTKTVQKAFNLSGAAILLISLCACGFQPVAAPNSMTTANAEIPLKDVAIKITARNDEERFQYLLEQELGRSVSITNNASNRLILDVVIEREGLAIAQNDTVTRFNLTATSDYKLQSSDGEAVMEGETVSITALNATASQFTTSVSERDALKRLATDVARRISTILRVHYSRANQTALQSN